MGVTNKVLVVGGGGREHALSWKLAQSKHVDTVYVAPGNPGTSTETKIVNIQIKATDIEELIHFAKNESIDLVVVGPEDPLVAGIVDEFTKIDIKCFGPTAKAAQLEGSKAFAKRFMQKYRIPTAAYQSFSDPHSAKEYLKNSVYPIVIKADGLAAGKGVIIAKNMIEAEIAINNSFQGSFGDAGKQILIEEFLEGPELSYFVVCDGNTYLPISNAQDHKKVGDGDIGPNTGGMGAFSPSKIVNEELEEAINNNIIEPTLKELINRGTPYQGILYAGLILTDEGPKLIEYNVRFGDPECQALLMRMKSNLLEILLASCDQTLENMSIKFYNQTALTVVMASRGYPGKYTIGSEINGIEKVESIEDVIVFQAGTIKKDNTLLSNGGRVLSITARGENIEQARKKAYEAIKNIEWKDGFYRSDIGLK